MKLNNIWGYGQLFGYSGLDGINRFGNDFVGTLTAKKIGIRFELREWIKVTFSVRGRVKFGAITGDMIDAQTVDGNVFITFADADTLVGYAPVIPKITGEKKLHYKKILDVDVWYSAFDAIGLKYCKDGDLYRFSIHHCTNHEEVLSMTDFHMKADVEQLKKDRYAYYENLPKCKNKKYEQLYYKALSVNKVNVHSPEGMISCRWTTPDRVPHRRMWLWDSVFHALAMVTYNQEIAKEAIHAVISQMRSDGFMPHAMSPVDSSNVTQPQVLAWGVWEVYQKTGDRAFLEEHVEALDKYLTWDMDNRDANNNGLLEWFTEPDVIECKCGESGLDNSPRFDFDEEMDAVDFSSFLAHDALYLSYIYHELGREDDATKWQTVYERTKEQMNALLWDEETGVYYDRLMNGQLSRVLTPASFFPMFAGIPSKEQAERMVEVLTDKALLWTPCPLATIAQDHPVYSNDMWRGGVWLNLNYFVIKGLLNYGYDDVAAELKNKTLEMVNKWYKKTGAIFEFFDPEDQIVPYACERKGKPTTPPDWRKHVHSIIDFNWSACFTLMFIQDEFY